MSLTVKDTWADTIVSPIIKEVKKLIKFIIMNVMLKFYR